MLAARGFGLVLVARDEVRLKAMADSLRTAHGTDTEILVADLVTEEGITAVVRRLEQGVDLLINNAGFGQSDKFLRAPVSSEVNMIRLHCETVLRLTYAALPGMIERRSGGVINVASVAAFLARGTYSATKAWTVTFTQSVRQEVGAPGVRLMALCPGWVSTEFHQRAGLDKSSVPGFMWLDADDLVRAALRDFRRGKTISVPKVRYKAVVALSRIVPRNLADRLSSRTGRHYD
ncbi:SDR family NAD(P)-dependent oxidoreductase [Streptomyces sp. NPDC002133]|uniref:SDR family NAD(P)-dependent oxidoreductase n=1 Tax=Streptomyces sp. NPDC002133 TaxID=3154409 RepID=UPI00332E4B40